NIHAIPRLDEQNIGKNRCCQLTHQRFSICSRDWSAISAFQPIQFLITRTDDYDITDDKRSGTNRSGCYLLHPNLLEIISGIKGVEAATQIANVENTVINNRCSPDPIAGWLLI